MRFIGLLILTFVFTSCNKYKYYSDEKDNFEIHPLNNDLNFGFNFTDNDTIVDVTLNLKNQQNYLINKFELKVNDENPQKIVFKNEHYDEFICENNNQIISNINLVKSDNLCFLKLKYKQKKTSDELKIKLKIEYEKNNKISIDTIFTLKQFNYSSIHL